MAATAFKNGGEPGGPPTAGFSMKSETRFTAHAGRDADQTQRRAKIGRTVAEVGAKGDKRGGGIGLVHGCTLKARTPAGMIRGTRSRSPCHLMLDLEPASDYSRWHLKQFTFILVAALVAGCSQSVHREDSLPLAIDFNSGEVGKPPPDFTTALTGGGGPISWVVRDNVQAPGHKVLIQESSDDTSYRFPLCIYDKAVVRDVSVEVKYKAISGKVDQAGGIVLRYNPENYYIARANVLEDNIDLFKTVNGKRSKVEEATVKITPGEWHTLRFQAKGPHLTVMFDGKIVIQTDDATFSEAGKVGLWTKADSVCAFTDLKISPSPDRQSALIHNCGERTNEDSLVRAWAVHHPRVDGLSGGLHDGASPSCPGGNEQQRWRGGYRRRAVPSVQESEARNHPSHRDRTGQRRRCGCVA